LQINLFGLRTANTHTRKPQNLQRLALGNPQTVTLA
jgi:hypothetical protein